LAVRNKSISRAHGGDGVRERDDEG
jgi:hypothetical protein